jgi:Fe-S cluster assembly ATP-binding protein
VSTLEIKALRVAVGGREILRGVDLRLESGEIHAVMGPNGSGKSTLAHALMGRPGYDVTGGSVTIDGTELIGLEPADRAKAGLFLAFQYPIEVPGVPVVDVLWEALAAMGRAGDRDELAGQMAAEAVALGTNPDLLARHMNVDLSGGEKKRNETLQLALLHPLFAVLDELDSGLDVDALGSVARRIEQARVESDPPLGVIAITHYRRLLYELKPDVVHVLSQGRIVRSGGPELASELEDTGYAGYRESPATDALPGRSASA